MVYLVIALVVVAVLLAMVPLVIGRNRQLDELERFQRARRMTTGWSKAALAHPPQPRREATGGDRGGSAAP